MRANHILLQMKYARVVDMFAREHNLTLDFALDFFYHSLTYRLMREGVGDFHCMSDGYLADELAIEMQEEKRKGICFA